MGKKRTAIVGEDLTQEDQEKLERVKRQKEAAKQVKMAEKGHVLEAKTAHVAGQKGGERVKDLTAEVLAEAEAIEKKSKEIQEASAKEEGKEPTKRVRRGSLGRGKIYKAAKSKVEQKDYPINESLKLLKDISYAKMDGTVELHLTLLDKNQSATIELPFATGKTKRIAIATDETIAKIDKGTIDFDVLLASPSQMGKLIKYAKTLGPRGLMPNPKNGTITDDPEKAAEKLSKSSQVTLRTDKDSVAVHTTVGKLSQKDEDLSANIKAVLSGFGGKLAKVTLKSTMSPGIHLQIP